MGMENLKDDLMDWIADTVAVWVTEDGCNLDEDTVENAILQEMDSLLEDMRCNTQLIMDRARTMIKEMEELE